MSKHHDFTFSRKTPEGWPPKPPKFNIDQPNSFLQAEGLRRPPNCDGNMVDLLRKIHEKNVDTPVVLKRPESAGIYILPAQRHAHTGIDWNATLEQWEAKSRRERKFRVGLAWLVFLGIVAFAGFMIWVAMGP